MCILSGGPFEFVCPSNSSDFTLLSSTRLHGTCQILHKDGTAIKDDVEYSITNLFPHTLFSQIDLEIDGQNLTNSDHLYPYKAYLETILSYGIDAKKSHLTTSHFVKDTADCYDKCDSSNHGYIERQKSVKGSKLFDFCINPHIDFLQTPRLLPPGVAMKFKMTRAKDSFSILSTSGLELMVKLHSLTLFIYRIQASEKIYNKFENTLSHRNAFFPVTKSISKKFTVPAGLVNANQPNLIHGKLPRQIVIGLTLSESMSGKLELNPFNFMHFDCNFIAIRVNGVQVPSKGFRPVFKDKIVRRELRALYDNIGIGTENHGCMLNVDDYCGGTSLFSFDLSPERCNGFHLHEARTGTIDLELCFDLPLPHAISVLCYAAYDHIFEMTKNRNITSY